MALLPTQQDQQLQPPENRRAFRFFREKYPQYAEWDDSKIMYALRKKYPQYNEWPDDKLHYAIENKYRTALDQGTDAPTPPEPAPEAPTTVKPYLLQATIQGFPQTLASQIEGARYLTGPGRGAQALRNLRQGKGWMAPTDEGIKVPFKTPNGWSEEEIDERLIKAADYVRNIDIGTNKKLREEMAAVAEHGVIPKDMSKEEWAKSINALQVAVGNSVAQISSAKALTKIPVIGPLLGVSSMSAMEGGGFSEQGRQLGLDPDIIEKYGAIHAAVAGPIEYLQNMWIASKYGKSPVKAAAESGLKKFLASGAGKALKEVFGVAWEGMEEVMQGGSGKYLMDRAIDEQRARHGLTAEQLPYQEWKPAQEFAAGAAISAVHLGTGAATTAAKQKAVEPIARYVREQIMEPTEEDVEYAANKPSPEEDAKRAAELAGQEGVEEKPAYSDVFPAAEKGKEKPVDRQQAKQQAKDAAMEAEWKYGYDSEQYKRAAELYHSVREWADEEPKEPPAGGAGAAAVAEARGEKAQEKEFQMPEREVTDQEVLEEAKKAKEMVDEKKKKQKKTPTVEKEQKETAPSAKVTEPGVATSEKEAKPGQLYRDPTTKKIMVKQAGKKTEEPKGPRTMAKVEPRVQGEGEEVLKEPVDNINVVPEKYYRGLEKPEATSNQDIAEHNAKVRVFNELLESGQLAEDDVDYITEDYTLEKTGDKRNFDERVQEALDELPDDAYENADDYLESPSINENMTVEEAAILSKGTTEDLNEAGYILSDGQLLDFSGKRQGGPAGQRAEDHRQLNIPMDKQFVDRGYEMVSFQQTTGAVRIDNNSGLVDIERKPTTAQKKQIRKVLTKNAGKFILDIRLADGSTKSFYGDKMSVDMAMQKIDQLATQEPGQNVPRGTSEEEYAVGVGSEAQAKKRAPKTMFETEKEPPKKRTVSVLDKKEAKKVLNGDQVSAIEKIKKVAKDLGLEIADIVYTNRERRINTNNPEHRQILKDHGFTDEEIEDAINKKEYWVFKGAHTLFTGPDGRKGSYIELYEGFTPEDVYHEFGHGVDYQRGVPKSWAGDLEGHADALARLLMGRKKRSTKVVEKYLERISDGRTVAAGIMEGFGMDRNYKIELRKTIEGKVDLPAELERVQEVKRDPKILNAWGEVYDTKRIIKPAEIIDYKEDNESNKIQGLAVVHLTKNCQRIKFIQLMKKMKFLPDWVREVACYEGSCFKDRTKYARRLGKYTQEEVNEASVAGKNIMLTTAENIQKQLGKPGVVEELNKRLFIRLGQAGDDSHAIYHGLAKEWLQQSKDAGVEVPSVFITSGYAPTTQEMYEELVPYRDQFVIHISMSGWFSDAEIINRLNEFMKAYNAGLNVKMRVVTNKDLIHYANSKEDAAGAKIMMTENEPFLFDIIKTLGIEDIVLETPYHNDFIHKRSSATGFFKHICCETGKCRTCGAQCLIKQPVSRTLHKIELKPAGNVKKGPVRAYEELPAFKKWFGKSKVIDENGDPKVMYHGTTEEFTEFSKDKIRPEDYDAPFNGFWFSSNDNTGPAMRGASSIMPVYLSIENPATANDWKKTYSQIVKESNSGKGNAIRPEARSIGDEMRYRLQEKGFDGVRWRGRPDINLEEYESKGETTFKSHRGGTYTIKKGEEWEHGGKKMVSTDLYQGSEHITGYSDIHEFMRLFGAEEVYVAFEPVQIKSAIGNGGGFDALNPDIRYNIEKRISKPFASKLVEVVDSKRFPDMPGKKQSIRKFFYRYGVTAAEYSWMDIDGWIEDNGDAEGNFDRNALKQYILDHQVRVVPVRYGDPEKPPDRAIEIAVFSREEWANKWSDDGSKLSYTDPITGDRYVANLWEERGRWHLELNERGFAAPAYVEFTDNGKYGLKETAEQWIFGQNIWAAERAMGLGRVNLEWQNEGDDPYLEYIDTTGNDWVLHIDRDAAGAYILVLHYNGEVRTQPVEVAQARANSLNTIKTIGRDIFEGFVRSVRSRESLAQRSDRKTRHDQYILDGPKEGYRELVITSPQVPYGPETNHFSEKGMLGWVRVDSRREPGTDEQMLFMEEFQEKREIKMARTKGYKDLDAQREADRLSDQLMALREERDRLYFKGLHKAKAAWIEAKKKEIAERKARGAQTLEEFADASIENARVRVKDSHPVVSSDLASYYINEDRYPEAIAILDRMVKGSRLAAPTVTDYYEKMRESAYKAYLDRLERAGGRVMEEEVNPALAVQFVDFTNEEVAAALSEDLRKDFERLELTIGILTLKQQSASERADKGVDPNPWGEGWYKIPLKYALLEAVRTGANKLAWTTGKQQADRWSSVVVGITSKISWKISDNNRKVVFFTKRDGSGKMQINVTSNGYIESAYDEINKKPLTDFIGNDIARKIMGSDTGEISGEEIAFGAKGFEHWYDEVAPGFYRKYTKRWGATVGKTKVWLRAPERHDWDGYHLQRNTLGHGWDLILTDPSGEELTQGTYLTKDAARKRGAEIIKNYRGERTQEVWYVTITDKMREDLTNRPQTLYKVEKRGPGVKREAVIPTAVAQEPKKRRSRPKAIQRLARTALRLIEPSKLVEWRHGGQVYADLVAMTHMPERDLITFLETKMKDTEETYGEFEDYLDKRYTRRELDDFMLSRKKGLTPPGMEEAERAWNALPKEMRQDLANMLKRTQDAADYAYKRLLDYVAKTAKANGLDADELAELNYLYFDTYFRGQYKNNKQFEKFMYDVRNYVKDFHRAQNGFLNPKTFKTYADARAEYGLELKHANPITNIKTEIAAIALLDAQTQLRDKFLQNPNLMVRVTRAVDAPTDWKAVGAERDPVWSKIYAEEEVARMLNNMLKRNLVGQLPALRFMRNLNNTMRIIKFAGSMFHQMSVTKQAFADNGWLGFMNPSRAFGSIQDMVKVTKDQHRSFLKDPALKQAYIDYVGLGGTALGGKGGQFELEIQAVEKLKELFDNNGLGRWSKTRAGRAAMAIPRMPFAYVDWLFEWYIPQLKFQAYLKDVAIKERTLGRPLSEAEKIDSIKEGQNFYGEMNERLFGRSGTVTSLMRFIWMAPGYAEGNYRTNLKALTQWGVGSRGSRSRVNIVNSIVLSHILAQVGTAIFTGAWRPWPKEKEKWRDMWKVDMGKFDPNGEKIMIDMMTYDKDYWDIYGKLIVGETTEIPGDMARRMGGMSSGLLQLGADVAMLMDGRAVIDWKDDKIIKVEDATLQDWLKFVTYEAQKVLPISASNYQNSRRRGAGWLMALATSILGVRFSRTEEDIRIREHWSDFYRLRKDRDEMYRYIGTLDRPMKTVTEWNDQIDKIMGEPGVPAEIKQRLKPLRIDLNGYVKRQQAQAKAGKLTPSQIRKLESLTENLTNEQKRKKR